jgi:hypothetical protein
MGQPHKGDRLLLQSPRDTPPELRSAVHSCATAAGLPISQYLADVLAVHVGRPDLVRDLGQREGLELGANPSASSRPLPRATVLQTRPPRPVWEAVHTLAAAAGLSAAQYLADVAAEHVGCPDLVRGLGRGLGKDEGLPLAM